MVKGAAAGIFAVPFVVLAWSIISRPQPHVRTLASATPLEFENGGEI